MIHLSLHAVVPLLAALAAHRKRWRYAFLVMLATMVVDLDHLLATPIYDPERCSIGFHPLHSVPAMLAYANLFALPLLWLLQNREVPKALLTVHLVGLGLLIHMALDWGDCLSMGISPFAP